MSRKKKHGKHHPQQRRRTKQHLHSVPTEPPASDGGEHADPLSLEAQPLFQGIRQGLRSDHPLDLLMAVSGLMTVSDERMRSPFDREDEGHVTLEQMIDSFVGVDYAETTAALTVLKHLVPDDLLAARIGQVLKGRRQPMPLWLTGLETAGVERVVEMTHALGDGDDYFLEVRLPAGETMTALVYVDHNMGGIVKDAFVIPKEFGAVEVAIHESAPDPETTIADVDPAVARAELTQAIDFGARTFPQPETDTWPAARPLVEWLVRMLPAGGSVRERREWTDDELEALREEFFESTYAEGVDGDDERSLLETILWYATDYGSSDPLRWSNVRVEILLGDWLPRKVVADVPYLAKVPALLRRYVEFCHDKVGFRRELTQEVLDAVDVWEPEYQRLIRSERPQGAAALASTVLAGSPDLDLEDVPTGELLLRHLDRDVGDRFTLMNLDTSPLPDEPFEWSGIPQDTHERVREVLELCDRCAEEFFDVEHRTAFRRFLSRAAVADPQIFRRRSAANRAAAAVCWAVAGANRTVGQGDGLESGELLAWFGVKGSISQRAEVFLRANGVDAVHTYGARHLGAPDLLTAERRERIVAERDRYLSWED